jgi:glycosyltransferase involved in cell wall biosynthesis
LDGLGRYTLGLVRGLLGRSDVEIHLLVPGARASDHPLEELLRDLRPAATTCDAGLLSPWAYLRVPGAVRRISPDLYHFPHFNLPVGLSVPAVATIHDLTPLTDPAYFRTGRVFKRAYFKLATWWTARQAAAVITPSNATASELVRLLRPRSRIVAIEEGVDTTFTPEVTGAEKEDFRSRHGLTRPFLLYVGVDRPHKNLARVIAAYAKAAATTPHDFVLVGQTSSGRGTVEDAVARAGVRERVKQLGYLDDRDLRVAYAAADAFVLCSLVEGFGLPVVEAMRSGTPVVTSRNGSTGDIGRDAALLVDPHSVESITTALLSVCSDSALREDLRRRGLRRAEDFTWERAAARTAELYHTVLS